MLTALLITPWGSPAQATPPPADQAAAQLIDRIAPSTTAILPPGKEREAFAGTSPQGTTITVHRERIELDPAGALPPVRISLPRELNVRPAQPARDGTLHYAADSSSETAADVAVQVITDGSVKISTIIRSKGSPTSFTYDFDLPTDARLKENPDGSVVIVDGTGRFIAGAARPWAIDAAGQAVATHFKVENHSLVQRVDITEQTTFPVVADPWLGVNLYNRVYVSTTSRGWVVNATPSAWGQAWNGVGTYFAHVDEVRSRVGVGRYNASIEQQHICHLIGYPFSLPEYNLESWRPWVVAAWSLPRYKCNS